MTYIGVSYPPITTPLPDSDPSRASTPQRPILLLSRYISRKVILLLSAWAKASNVQRWREVGTNPTQKNPREVLYLMVSTPLKICSSNYINRMISPGIRAKIKNLWVATHLDIKKSCRVPGGSSSSINRSLHCLHPEKWLNSRSPAERQKRRSPWCMPVIETTHCPASRAHHQTCRPWERRKYLDFKTLEGDCENSIC